MAYNNIIGSEEQFSILVECVKDYAIFMIDTEGYILTWNIGAQHIKGYTAEEIIGKHISVFYTEAEINNKEPEKNLELTKKKGRFEQEGWRVRKDGSQIWADVVFTAIYNKEGQHIGFSKVTRDNTEKKKAEEDLKLLNESLERRVQERTEEIMRSEKKFRALLERNDSIIVMSDENLKPLYRSPSYGRITGWDDEESRQNNQINLIHPDDAEQLRSDLKTMFASPYISVPVNYRLKHLDGHYIHLNGTITNMLNDVDLKAVITNVRDVTEQKEAYQKLEKSLQEITDYKYALDESSIIAIIDKKGIIEHVNDNFCNISKYSREELIGQSFGITSSTYHSKEYIDNLWLTVSSGHIWKGELKNLAKDGSFFWGDTTIVPFLDDDNKPSRYISIRSDITQKKIVEEELIVSASIYRNIAANLPNTIITIADRNDVYTLAEGEGMEQLGLKKEDIEGRHTSELSEPGQYDKLLNCRQRALAGETVTCEIETRGFFYLLRFVPLKDETGYVYAVLTISLNITDTKKAETEIRALNETLEVKVKERTTQLEESNKELESFSYSVSHDLRAPLRAIGGYAKIIGEDYGSLFDAEGYRLLNVITDNAHKMGILIDDLLAFSRLGKKEINRSAFKMERLVEEVLSDYKTANHKAEFIVSPLPDSFADHALIKQVFANLISNAVKYSSKKDNPIVEISAKSTAEGVIYTIKDNGVGFDAQYAHKLFGVFQRLHSSVEFEGTGVGLAIVHRIISKHGGKIWAEAEQGLGATFNFLLPIHKS